MASPLKVKASIAAEASTLVKVAPSSTSTVSLPVASNTAFLNSPAEAIINVAIESDPSALIVPAVTNPSTVSDVPLRMVNAPLNSKAPVIESTFNNTALVVAVSEPLIAFAVTAAKLTLPSRFNVLPTRFNVLPV